MVLQSSSRQSICQSHVLIKISDVAGDITLDQFLENLKYMKGITFQYFFGTEAALAKLTKV